MDEKLKEMMTLTARNNELLKEALISAKRTRNQLKLELIKSYSDDLADRIISIDKEIDKAEKLVDCTAKEGQDIFLTSYPKLSNDGITLNGNGVRRFNFLKKKLGL